MHFKHVLPGGSLEWTQDMLGTPSEEMEEVAGEREACSLLKLLSLDKQQKMDRWMFSLACAQGAL